jgi:hypothetical protein
MTSFPNAVLTVELYHCLQKTRHPPPRFLMLVVVVSLVSASLPFLLFGDVSS